MAQIPRHSRLTHGEGRLEVNKTKIDLIVDEYLSRLDSALDQLPSSRREQLIEEITEHLHEARAALPSETESAVRELLDRVGRPEDIAAAALADHSGRSRRRLNRRLALAIMGFALPFAVAIALLVLLSGGGRVGTITTSTTTVTNPLTATTPPGPTATNPATITVPQVIGEPIAQATSEIRSLGLNVQVSEERSNAVPSGRVISQGPVAGQRMLLGSTMSLSVSSGP